MRLTWRREPSETGLARVCQSPRGAILKCDGRDVAHIEACRVGYQRYDGWYWYTHAEGLPLHNSHATPVADIDQAKRECEDFVRKHFA